MVSGYPTPMNLPRVDGLSKDPWDRGVTALYQSLGTRIPMTRWGMGLVIRATVGVMNQQNLYLNYSYCRSITTAV